MASIYEHVSLFVALLSAFGTYSRYIPVVISISIDAR